MHKFNKRLTALTSADISKLQSDADELACMQNLLNNLPLALKVEDLSDRTLDRLRQIARAPVQELCGGRLLSWNNMCRTRGGLNNRT